MSEDYIKDALIPKRKDATGREIELEDDIKEYDSNLLILQELVEIKIILQYIAVRME